MPPMGEWINKPWYVHTMKDYSATTGIHCNADEFQNNQAE